MTKIVSIIIIISCLINLILGASSYLVYQTSAVKLGTTKFQGVFYDTSDLNKSNITISNDEDSSTIAKKLSYIQVYTNGTQYGFEISSKDVSKVMLYAPSSKYSPSNESNSTETSKNRRLYIFSPDTRSQITSAATAPTRQTGYLRFQDKTGTWYYCTGTLIGPKQVLTAGSCLHSGRSGDWYRNFQFCPGRISSSCSKWYSYSTAFSPSGWVSYSDISYNYGVLVLSEFPGRGYLGFGYDTGLDEDAYFYGNGYQNDKSSGTMWQTTCSMDDVETLYMVDDRCDFVGGLGIAMYHFKGGVKRVIYGVHSASYRDCGFFSCDNYNFHTRITSTRFYLLCDILSETSCSYDGDLRTCPVFCE